jgi:putative DNA primase/helicase
LVAANYEDVLRQLLDAGLVIRSDGLRIGTHKPVRTKVQGADHKERGWYWLREWSPAIGRTLIVGSYGIWHGTDNGAQKILLPKDEDGRITQEQREAMRRVWAEASRAAELQRNQEAAAAAHQGGIGLGETSAGG